MIEVRMPKFGLSMEKGFITKWYKKEGDNVSEGEPLFEVESEKITNDVPSPGTGFLKRIVVPEGEEQAVGEIVAYIAENEEELKKEVEKTAKEEVLLEEEKEETEAPKVEQKPELSGFIKASPIAKRLAREHGIDLSLITGTGPGGRIVEKDVLNAISEGKTKPSVRKEKLSPLRKTIARHLSESYQSSVLVTNMTEVDMSSLFEFKNTFKEKVSVTAILVKLLAEALKELPKFNVNFDGEEVTYFSDVNIGVAVSTDKGLVVPVVKNANVKSVSEINAELKNLSLFAREGKLTDKDLSGSHFTLTNLGMMRTEMFTPVLNQGEVAILGVGRTVKKPVVVEGDKIAIRPMCWLSLSYDHRWIDGADAAEFLGEIASLIESREIYNKL